MSNAIANRYEILSALGEGGMGKVLSVHDSVTDREVALKLVRASGRDAYQQLKHEFWTMTRLRHPNTVEVYDYGALEDGTPYFTMEIVAGQGLDARLPMRPAEVREVLAGLLRALAFIHAQGYVHGDLKPENVRLTPDGKLKLMDFGLMDRAGRQGGPIRGTLLYLSPEVARGGRVDQRSDLYSLGAVAFHLLTGFPPFGQSDPTALLKAHREAPPPTIRDKVAGVEEDLEAIVMRLMAKDPLRRFQSAGAVLEALGYDAEDVGTRVLSPSFTGRTDELKRLSERLESSEGGAVTIEGPSGSGKTRLAQEVALLAQLNDRATATVRSHQHGAPYAPVIQSLRELLPLARTAAPRVLELNTPVLSRILPELAGGQEPEPLEPQQEKMRLQAAVGEVLTAIARSRGVLLVVDDAQWLDASSRELLEYLARNARSLPFWVVLVGATAPEPVEAIALANLDPDDSRRMMASMLGTEALGPELIQPMLEISEGNPRYLHDLVHHVVESGQLARVDGQWRPKGGFGVATLPRTLQGMLGQKLDALGPEASQVAKAVAVAIGAVPLGLLTSFEGLPKDELLFQALAELEAEDVLESGSQGYVFSQARLREAILGTMEEGERQQLHGQWASVLVPLLEAHPQDAALLNAITDHLLQSENPRLALDYAARAGARNQELFATSEARRFFKAGFELFDGEDDTDPALKLRYLKGLGDSERRLGQFPEAKEHLEAAIAVAESLDDTLAKSQLQTGLGKVLQATADYEGARKALAEAARTAEAAGSPKDRVRALTTMGRITYFGGDQATTVQVYTEALEVSRSAQLPVLLAECLAFLGYLFSSDPVRQEQGLAYLQESLTIKHTIGDKVGLNDTTMLLGNAYLALGRYAEANECFMQCQQLNAEIGQQDEELFSYLNLAIVALEMGDLRESLQLALTAHEGSLKLKSRFAEGMAIALTGIAGLYMGDVGEGLARIDQGLALARETNNRYLEVTVAVYRSEALLLVGRFEEALGYARTGLGLAEETGVREVIPQQQVLLGLAQLYSNEREAARSSLVTARKTTSEANARGTGIKALWGLALLAAQSRDFSSAQALANEALQDAQETQANLLAVQLQIFLGELQLVQDRRSLAVEHLKKAQTLLQRVESPLIEARVHRLLAEADGLRTDQHRRAAKAVTDRVMASVPEDLKQSFLAAWNAPYVPHPAGSGLPGKSVEQRLSKIGSEISELLAYVHERESRWSNLETVHQRLEQLIDFALKINQIHELQLILEMAMDLILEIAQAERGFLLLYRGEELEVCELRNILDEQEDGDWQISRSIADEVLRTEQPLCLHDVLSDERFSSSQSVQALRVRTVLCVPLKIRNVVVGALYVDRQSVGNSFSEGDLDVVMSLAALVATAIENANLQQQWQDKSRKLELLNDLARTMSTTLVMEEVLDLVVHSTLEVTQAERGFLLLWENERLECKAAYTREGHPIPMEQNRISRSICSRVIESGEPLAVADALEDEELQVQESILALNLRTVMCVPLISKQRLLGVLYVDSQAIVNTFTDRDLELLEAIAHHASVAIENAHLYTQLSRRAGELESLLQLYEEANLRASTDALTGLHNRRYMQDQLVRDFAQAKRHRRFLSVIMLDIDHFKSFNDTYGHAMGDQVIMLVSNVLQQAIRLSDVVARYGGEEFVVSLPDTDTEGAHIVAERIRRAVTEIELTDAEGNALRQITVSLGIASLKLQDERMDELLERADRGLYVAKMKGRNQVQIIEE